MADLPVQGLLQQLNARPISGEHLEVLGKSAADRWQAGGCGTLTEAVVEAVKTAGLAPEQVRRVVEFANTHAYLTEFKKESAPHKVVDFGAGGPADAAEVLRDLNDGGGGSLYDRGTLDYEQPPPAAKIASASAEQGLTALFGEPAAPLPFEEPFAEALAIRDKLASVNGHLLSEMSGLEVMYADLADRLYSGVKQAALEGTSLSDIVQAWAAAAPSEEHVKVAFTHISPRLLREGVFASRQEMLASVEKTASAGIVNHDHPLIQDFSELCEVLSKLASTRAARAEVRVSLDQMTGMLKAASAGGLLSHANALANRASKPAGKAVGKAVKVLAGDHAAQTAENVARFGVKHAPTAALLVGANEVRRHMQYGPVGRPLSDAVLKHVPMTPQYHQHNYEIASGQ